MRRSRPRTDQDRAPTPRRFLPRRCQEESLRWSATEGSAALEFITAGLILLVPLVYLVIALAAIQGGALAIEGGARQAARVYVESPSREAATTRSTRAVELALADYGLDSGATAITVRCRPDPADCFHRKGFVTISVRTRVPLPLAPPAVGAGLPLGVTLQTSATQQVSRFWGAAP